MVFHRLAGAQRFGFHGFHIRRRAATRVEKLHAMEHCKSRFRAVDSQRSVLLFIRSGARVLLLLGSAQRRLDK